ncbi:hypothetical protein F5Y14DRAFT_407076 [Nemania sp. NC0429]|nr:hypothetical protein F5Y14DRAFT_407076 [Nemania sp. NC0429]
MNCKYYATKRAGRKQPRAKPITESGSEKTPAQSITEPPLSSSVQSEMDSINVDILWVMGLLPSPDDISSPTSGVTTGGLTIPFDAGTIPGTPPSTERSLIQSRGDIEMAEVFHVGEGNANLFSTPDLSFLTQHLSPLNNNADQVSEGGKMDFALEGSALTTNSTCNSPLDSASLSIHDRGVGCWACALNILSRLDINTTNCAHASSSGNGNPEMAADERLRPSKQKIEIDQLIMNNTETVEAARKMLDCPCSKNNYLLSMIAFIALKVLDTYAAVTYDLPSGPEGRGGGHDDSQIDYQNTTSTGIVLTRSHETDRGNSYPVYPIRLPIENSNDFISVEEKGRITAQQVMGELHRVQRLVNDLSRRLGDQTQSKDGGILNSSGEGKDLIFGSGELAVPFSGTLMRQLETDLRKHLRVVSGQIQKVLRHS